MYDNNKLSFEGYNSIKNFEKNHFKVKERDIPNAILKLKLEIEIFGSWKTN